MCLSRYGYLCYFLIKKEGRAKMLDIGLLSVNERQCWFIDCIQSGANGCYIRLVLVDPGLRTPNCGVLGSRAQIIRETNG